MVKIPDRDAVVLVDTEGTPYAVAGGGTSTTDDAAFTPASSSVTPAGHLFDDVAPDSVDEGDVGVGRMSANRNQYVTVRDAAGNERGLNVDATGGIAVTASAGTNLNTSALATSAKQDTLLTELQLKADLTETQPVSLATVPSHAVTNAGVFATQVDGAALTALQKIDNIAHAGSDVALVEHVPISGQFDDTATTAVTENQVAPVRISSRRALLVEGVASGTAVPVSGTVTANLAAGVNNIGDVDVLTLPALVAGTANIGDVDVLTLPALVAGSATIGAVTGPTADNAANPILKLGTLPGVALAAAPVRTEGAVNPVRLNLAGDVAVTLDAEAVVLGAGTAEIGKLAAGVANIGDVDVLTVPADPFGVNADASSATGSISAKLKFLAAGIAGATSLPAGVNNIGDIDVLSVNAFPAHDAPIAGNPLRASGRAITADYTAVATGDTADLITTILGKQVVKLDAIPDLTWVYAAAAGGLVNTTEVTAKAAGAAGVRNYVKSAQVINSHATISTEVVIRDGTAGTVLHRGWAQAAGGGYAMTFDPPLRGTAATLISIGEITATGTAGVLVNLQGFSGAE